MTSLPRTLLIVLLVLPTVLLAEAVPEEELAVEFPAVEEALEGELAIEDEGTPASEEIDAGPEFLEGVEPGATAVQEEEQALLDALAGDPSAQNRARLARLYFGLSLREAEATRADLRPERIEAALEYAQGAVALQDDQPLFWSWLGWLYSIGAEDPVMDVLAERALLTALALNPQAPQARLALARLYRGRGEIDHALDVLESLLQEVAAEVSAEAIAETARTYSEGGRAADGAAFFTALPQRPEFDAVALRLALGGLRWASGDTGAAELLRQVREDPAAGPGARQWAGVLLDPKQLAGLERAAGVPNRPTEPAFWARVARSVIAVQDAADLLGEPVDAELRAQSEELVEASPESFARVFPNTDSPAAAARAHAGYYRRVSDELDRLGPAVMAGLRGTLEPLEAQVEEETDADLAILATRAVIDFYAAVLDGLGEYLRFSPDAGPRLALAAGMQEEDGLWVGDSGRWPPTRLSEALLDPFRAGLVAWLDFAEALEDHVARLEAEEPLAEVAP